MPRRGLLAASPGLAAISVLGLGLLALFLGYRWFWMVWVLGFVIAVPLVAILSEALAADEPPGADERSEEDALAVLRDRYARGEIDEAELERRLERLLGTETVDEAREWVGADEGERAAAVERD